MFKGSVPTVVARLAEEHFQAWPRGPVYVGCSGEFAVERHLTRVREFEIHSNDTSLLSAALGGYFSGDPLELHLTDFGRREFGWVEDHLEDPREALAAVVVLSGFPSTLKRGERPLQAALRDQWPRLHLDAFDKLEGVTLDVASYTNEDVTTWITQVPADAPVVVYVPRTAPSTALSNVFHWTPPPSAPLEGDTVEQLCERVADRPHWLFAADQEIPGKRDILRGVAKPTDQAPTIRLYGSHRVTRRVAPKQRRTRPPKIRHLQQGDQLTGELRLSVISPAQYDHLRSMYRGFRLAGKPDLALAVVDDDRLVGAFGFALTDDCHLMNVVATSSNLDQLIEMASLSTEATELARRTGGRPYRSLTTHEGVEWPMSKWALGEVHEEWNQSTSTS